MTTGGKIKAARQKAGFTQKRLGELCGIAESTIRRYESGKLNPKIETIEKIAQALQIPITHIKPDLTWGEYEKTQRYQKTERAIALFDTIVEVLEDTYGFLTVSEDDHVFGYDENTLWVFDSLENHLEISESDIFVLEKIIKNWIPLLVEYMIDVPSRPKIIRKILDHLRELEH